MEVVRGRLLIIPLARLIPSEIVDSNYLAHQILIHFSIESVLEDKVNAIFIPEITVHPQDIPVIQMALNLKLPPYQMLRCVFDQSTLLHPLESDNELRRCFSSQK
jgi:hypothetical protein